MKVTLDTKSIQTINLFQSLSGTSVIDCFDTEEKIYFVVANGQYARAIGKNGAKVKNAQTIFKKHLQIYEYSPDLKTFVKNLIPEAQDISVSEKEVKVTIKPYDRASVIGKNGKNIKVVKMFLNRIFGVDDLKLKVDFH